MTFGRVLFGLPFIGFAAIHFSQGQALADLVVPKYFPMPVMLVYLVGVVFLLSGIAVIANRWVIPTLSTLAAVLFIIICVVHVPQLDKGSLSFLLKDTIILGAAVFMVGVAATASQHRSRRNHEERSED